MTYKLTGTRFFICVLIAATASLPARSQEMSGNFWVNPQTGRLEKLDLSAPNGGVRISQRSAVDWTDIASLQGGLKLQIDAGHVETITAHSIAEEHRRVWTRIINPRGYQIGSVTPYLVFCSSFDLRTDDLQQVPLSPGSAAEAIYNWNCR